MSQFGSSRKRTRPCEDDCCELMPISKRINDLHIRSPCRENNSNIDNGVSAMHITPDRPFNLPQASPVPMSYEPRPQYGLAQQYNASHAQQQVMPNYMPELSASQNPYYYRANEVLYEAHVEKLHRDGKSVL